MEEERKKTTFDDHNINNEPMRTIPNLLNARRRDKSILRNWPMQPICSLISMHIRLEDDALMDRLLQSVGSLMDV